MGAVAAALLASGLLDDRRTVAGQQSGVSAIEAIEPAERIWAYTNGRGLRVWTPMMPALAGVHEEQEYVHSDVHAALVRQAEALQRENADLREALEPFAEIADLVDSETEGVADSDEFQMHFHDYLMASWKLSIFRRARALIGGENAGN